MFIAVEGPDGAGKTTLVRLLHDRLVASGRNVVRVREPGGTPVAERARAIVLDPTLDVGAEAELFLMLAARADLVRRVIRPALDEGRVVLADRFALSTVAYQGHGRGLSQEAVAQAIALATGGLVPDLTIVLDVSPAVVRQRRGSGGRTRDRLEREDNVFHDRVAQAFRSATGPGIVHVDADGGIEEVLGAAWTALKDTLPEVGT